MLLEVEIRDGSGPGQTAGRAGPGRGFWKYLRAGPGRAGPKFWNIRKYYYYLFLKFIQELIDQNDFSAYFIGLFANILKIQIIFPYTNIKFQIFFAGRAGPGRDFS